MRHGEPTPVIVIENADGEMEIVPSDMHAFLVAEREHEAGQTDRGTASTDGGPSNGGA